MVNCLYIQHIELKVTAGKALVLLSDTELLSQTGSISVFIKSKYGNIVHRLTEILDAKNKIIYRTTAAKILENLCTHHAMDNAMDNNHMKNTLLPKVTYKSCIIIFVTRYFLRSKIYDVLAHHCHACI
jgi:hypothetical protein